MKLRQPVEHELPSRVKAFPPEFFERIVVKLLTYIGDAGTLADAGKTTLPCLECIVSRLCSPFVSPVGKYWESGDLNDFSNKF